MRASLLAVLATASLVSGETIRQLVAQLPACSDSCFQQYVPQVCPTPTDFTCSCRGSASVFLQNKLTPCVLGACTLQEATLVNTISLEICDKVNFAGSSIYSLSVSQTGGGTVSSAPNPTGQTGQTSGGSSSSHSGSSSLSIGVIVGIAVGGAAAIAVIVLLVVLLLRQRRRHRKQAPSAGPHEDGQSPAPAMATGTGAPPKDIGAGSGFLKTPAMVEQQRELSPGAESRVSQASPLIPPVGRPELYTAPGGPTSPYHGAELPAYASYQHPHQGPGELHAQYLHPQNEMYGGNVPLHYQAPRELPADSTYPTVQR